MPIYEYRCQDCGAKFSLFQRMGADQEGLTCPKCESSNVDRLLSSFASSSSSSAGSGGSCPSGGSGFS
jgi:putative FmdB family regulatory protein